MLHERVLPLAREPRDVRAHEGERLGHARVEDDAGVVAREARPGQRPRVRDAVHGDERPHPDPGPHAARGELGGEAVHRRELPVRLAPRPTRGGVDPDRRLPARVDDRERPVVAGGRERGHVVGHRADEVGVDAVVRAVPAVPAVHGRGRQSRPTRTGARTGPEPPRRPTRRRRPRARRPSPRRACGSREGRRGRRSACRATGSRPRRRAASGRGRRRPCARRSHGCARRRV